MVIEKSIDCYQAVYVLALLLYYLGYPALAGFILLIFMLPFQIWLGRVFARLRLETASFTGKTKGSKNTAKHARTHENTNMTTQMHTRTHMHAHIHTHT